LATFARLAFYATLLPVLPISKYETQYTYAGSIALAIALALLWERQWFVAVSVALLTLMLVAHGLMIQQRMYFLWLCQTRALEALKAVLKDGGPEAPRAVLIRDEDALWRGRRRHVPCGARQFLPPSRRVGESVGHARSRQSRNGLSPRLQRVDPVRIACWRPNQRGA
jgi:hypothetical protein